MVWLRHRVEDAPEPTPQADAEAGPRASAFLLARRDKLNNSYPVGRLTGERRDRGGYKPERARGGSRVCRFSELNAVSKHFGAIHALNEVDMTLEAGEVLGPDGRQWRRQVDPGQGHRRQFSPDPWRDPPRRRARAFSQAGRGAREGHRGRLSGPRALQQSVGGRQCVPRPRDQARRGSVPLARPRRDGQARRRTVRRTQVGDPAPRSRAPDVGRPAPGGRDRAHPALEGAPRADGRADRRDLGAGRSPRCSTSSAG